MGLCEGGVAKVATWGPPDLRDPQKLGMYEKVCTAFKARGPSPALIIGPGQSYEGPSLVTAVCLNVSPFLLVCGLIRGWSLLIFWPKPVSASRIPMVTRHMGKHRHQFTPTSIQ